MAASNSTPLSLVIFGASGDLAARKLIPALYRLAARQRLPEEARIVGVARTPLSHDAFRARLQGSMKGFLGSDWRQDQWDQFARRLFYTPGDASKPEGLNKLQDWLREQEGEKGGRRLYYLSVAPDLYPEIATCLGEARMSQEEGSNWRRLVIEKPFGHDKASAKELNRILARSWEEAQIYRIDHYLGKETVQNILVFRFANTLFEPLWNSNFIDHVQITVSETVKVGSRGDYYDKSGVLRDMFQNHLLQILALVAMESPARFAADTLRNEKVKVLDAVSVHSHEEACGGIVSGQYAGYRSEPGVATDSKTPTYAALRLYMDNWRWQGVPFYLRSGKGLARRYSEVIIQFRCPPHLMFPLPKDQMLECNRLSLCLQPDEGIHLSFQAKAPDQDGVVLHPTELDFHYRDAFPDTPIPEAYERLLLDAMQGDAHLFMRSDEIERAWEIMDPLIAATERPDAPRPEEYAVGSWGPKCANEFLARDGRQWLAQCVH